MQAGLVRRIKVPYHHRASPLSSNRLEIILQLLAPARFLVWFEILELIRSRSQQPPPEYLRPSLHPHGNYSGTASEIRKVQCPSAAPAQPDWLLPWHSYLSSLRYLPWFHHGSLLQQRFGAVTHLVKVVRLPLAYSSYNRTLRWGGCGGMSAHSRLATG